MKKNILLIVFCCLLAFSVISVSQPTYAYNATTAVRYADTHALHPNTYAYRTFASDCTNFVS